MTLDAAIARYFATADGSDPEAFASAFAADATVTDEGRTWRGRDEITAWRAVCPDITLRSTFIVGYPGETEAEFQTLLDWMDEAQLDRVGCFQYENVAGARSNALPRC